MSQADSLLLKAKSDALKLLSFQPRSVEELRKRLKLKKYSETLIGQVLDQLKLQGLLNDEKFAKFFSQSRLHTHPSGKKRLQFELKQKGITPEVAQRVLDAVSEDEEAESAKEIAARYLRSQKGVPRVKQRVRLYGFLRRRGYQNELVFKVMNELFKGLGEAGVE